MPTLRLNRDQFSFLVAIAFLAFSLAGVSNQFASVYGWWSFVAILLASSALIWFAWRVLQNDNPPQFIFWLVAAAIVLRLAMGAIWFLALPDNGYDTDIQNAGYVMQDAFNRDRAAWALARSDQPLLSAFQGYSSTDQYGGLLFLSATVYRYLGGEVHQPLLMIVIAATVSGLAVAFTWAFSRRLWGDKIAGVAAWGLALYPEAVLLGSSQMREAFMVCLVPLAIYGLLRFREQKNLVHAGLALFPILLSVPLSFAFTPSLFLLLGLLYFSLDGWKLFSSREAKIGFVLFGALALIGLVVFAAPLGSWLVDSARWQAYVSENASGWVAREFERLPIGAQVPFLVVYGLLRPLLPAALVDAAPTIWMAIGIWRSLGWTVLLALLVYATYLTFRTKAWKAPLGALLASGWVVSLVASYRGGGDLWDNPRYRSAFAAVQIGVAAWAWMQQRELKDPWLRRAVFASVCVTAWFVPWYLRRQVDFDWPIINLDQVVGLGLVSAGLYVLWDCLNELSHRKLS